MPARSKSSVTGGPQPSILLLEEYDALAAAVTSALKKFAPKHSAIVARSLADAEKLGSQHEPELFVLDVDPPWRGLSSFLEKIAKENAKARALVIGGAVPAEILAARESSGALQFIEKPFELAAFGAAVQALLGPWREMKGRGMLGALDVLDLVLAHCAANASVAVQLQSRRKTGEIQIAAGQVVHATAGRSKGEDALAEMLQWSLSHVSERKLPAASRRTISNWRTVVLESFGEPEAQAFEAGMHQEEPEVEIQARTGKKIVVVDDTEMLLIFVEDVLSTADPDLQITTARNGTDGLREIQRIMPDLVLLDYSLPDLNGDEVCERLLENERTARIPVLMMSGHVPEMDATARRFPNVVAKIEKPFFSEALVDLVQRTLETEHQFESSIDEEQFESVIVEPELEPEPEPELPPPPPLPPPPLPPKRTAPEPPRRAITPTLAPPPAHIERHPPVAASAAAIRVAPTDGNAAVLGVFLEVLSMQLTSQLQMGAIRARPSSMIASLRLQSAATRSAIPSELGFQLGPAKLNGDGRISTLRLIPTAKPFQPAQTRTAFEIGGVALIPNETRARVQLTPSGTTPMTMELFAHLELDAVELSANFQVAQLILNWGASDVRVTLNPKAPEQTAAKFEMRVLKLDESGRISELLLSPVR
nr:protein-glutamate methylesterase/protein-glutamine glutaminase [uncultured bacterium]